MTDGKNKDIVEEVFSRSNQADDRVSALFTHLKHPPLVSLEKDQKSPSDLKESPAAKDTGSSGNKLFRSDKNTKYEVLSKRTIKNKELTHQVRTVVVVGLVVVILALLMGSYLRQHGNDSTKMMQEKQPLLNVQPESVFGKPESVFGKINKNSTVLDWQHVINWSSLLYEISATIPKTVRLSVLESGDGSQLFLEGEAFSADAIHDFADALNTNRQIKLAELNQIRIGKWESQDVLIFSISCCLVSDAKPPGSLDGDYNNSGFDRSRLFTPKEAEKFFGSIQPISERTGCMVKSLPILPKNVVFEDEKTNGRIIKKYAALTLLGGYQNILNAVEKLQNRSQGVWFDSISIKQGSETEGLECSMAISVYVAEGTG